MHLVNVDITVQGCTIAANDAGNNGAAPGKAKKKKGKGADESSNGGALEGEADFDLGGENMPSAMAKWCVEQMRGLTGSDDVTLAHFLFSLQDDTEVESYLSMYLGKSDAVSAFAKEFTLRKKAARGLGGDLLARMSEKQFVLHMIGDLNGARQLIFRLENKIKADFSLSAVELKRGEEIASALMRLGV